MTKNIMIVGVGGQGSLLASKLLGRLLMDEGYPIFNLRSAFPYIIDNNFPTPCYQCVVMENGELSTCGRCIHVPGLCDECGYFFAAEYALVFRGNLRVITEMLRTYTRYV